MDEKKIARAEHKYARISPRKVEIICNMIRGKDAKVALALMENTPKAGCELMIKVLKSAIANAEGPKYEMDPDKLYVVETYANAGPILKRGMPRAQGRMYRINKRTSHIVIAVAERDCGKEAELWDRKLILMACASALSKTGIPVGTPEKTRSAI